MAFQDPYITLERIATAESTTIYGDAEFVRDAVGNLTVTWQDPLKSRASPARLRRADLEPFASENVEQQRNRSNAWLCITDPGGSLLKVTWREIDPWTGMLVPEQVEYGVVSITSASARGSGDGLSLLVYRADYRCGRGSGLLETRPVGP